MTDRTKQFACDFEGCGQRFYTKRSLSNHAQSHKFKQKKLQLKETARRKHDPQGKLAAAQLAKHIDGPAGPNAPRISGRGEVLKILDRLLKQEDLQQCFEKAFTESIKDNAQGFFERIIMPLLPKETITRMLAQSERKATITIFRKEAEPIELRAQGGAKTVLSTDMTREVIDKERKAAERMQAEQNQIELRERTQRKVTTDAFEVDAQQGHDLNEFFTED